MNHLPDAILQTDFTGIIEYCNPSQKSILGYDSDYLVGKSIFDFVHPQDLSHIVAVFNFGLLSQSLIRMTFHFRHADNHYLYVEITGNVLYNDQGKISGAVFCIRDISHRIVTENILRFSQEKFAKAFLSNPGPISISTFHEGRFVEVNNAFLELSGYEHNEIIGHTLYELDLWVDLESRNLLLKRIQTQGSVVSVELQLRAKSGEILTVLLSMEIIDMLGEPYLLSILQDITERKRMEEALRLSEECFAKAFHASPITMCISTLDEGRMINVNETFCQLIGHTRKKMIGHSTLELGIWLDPAERKGFERLIKRDGKVRNLEARWVTKSGQILEGLLSAERLLVDGQICILTTFTDMTKKRQMEKEINRLDRLNLVGQMAASIGHEIRNPMTTVRGFLQVLKYKDKFQDESETFDLMIEELDRANSIISEFLSLARNKLITPEQSDLNAIISNMFPLIQASATAQDKSVELNLSDLPVLLLDQKEIRQLILNLVQNGFEAMVAGGILTISTYFNEQSAILSIHDQGHGMSQDVKKNIGTPFFTTKDDGTGLGIPICYGIANRHNAPIKIYSSTEGTEFRISFPIPTNQLQEPDFRLD
ncbi:MAG TPA: PAS domain S-box protein [Syntrophomonadaceae bacterium]|nr:PAS domain S-box protein [Syntrophomonadaceae bacterium]